MRANHLAMHQVNDKVAWLRNQKEEVSTISWRMMCILMPAREVIFSLTLSEKGHPRATSVRLVGQALHAQREEGLQFCCSILFMSPGRWQRAEGMLHHAVLEVWANWERCKRCLVGTWWKSCMHIVLALSARSQSWHVAHGPCLVILWKSGPSIAFSHCCCSCS